MFFKGNKLTKAGNLAKKSFSQCGEDLIISFVFEILGINKPFYIDIGAHHPWYLSNTAHFYENGSTGILIEADPNLCKVLSRERKRDTIINAGVTESDQGAIDFYIFDAKTLSTFSKEEAERLQRETQHKIERILKIPTMSFATVVENQNEIDLLNIDIEGKDFEVLNSIDFLKIRPKVICVETLTYDTNNQEKKLLDTISYLKSKDYMVFADTYINTVFVDQTTWNNR